MNTIAYPMIDSGNRSDSAAIGTPNDAAPSSDRNVELSIVMPCLNEVLTVETCIEKARRFLDRAGVAGEVVIADNGSTDGSQLLAANAGARVVDVPAKGYGSALIGGIRAARGRFVIMGDADDSYDFEHLDGFVERLRAGAQLVMGNRFRGGIMPGAMPALHRYLGNPVLSFIGRLFFWIKIGDFHCGLRGFEREAILNLRLASPGMEFASEMVVKASLARLRIAEVPTILKPDGRNRPPHLRTWRDGWRHLRFLFLHSPRWLFFYPGIALALLGLAGLAILIPGPIRLGNVALDIHTMLYAATALIIGLQMVAFSVFTKVVGVNARLLPPDPRLARLVGTFSLERGIIAGFVMMVLGLAWSVSSVLAWRESGFGVLNPEVVMRNAIPAITLVIAGSQVFLSALFLGVLDLSPKQT